ncbi:hypothetical protein [Flagellimonas allohymeniacidonis]|uniref:Uncharacterized protein n=1 Tax=Flagellimonas allohymeniacidonis TaxID=2517819 RepID=A0A4Q8QJ51_9FLAO|nr:hypothetical protein [Allomuricauda hymeniacidonis]TAI48489.1 hypothetical protein EW142_01405 [Allomuricauda hymeniacidonis]
MKNTERTTATARLRLVVRTRASKNTTTAAMSWFFGFQYIYDATGVKLKKTAGSSVTGWSPPAGV